MSKKKHECIVLERFEELARENKTLKAKLKMLTGLITTDSKEYRDSLKKSEEEKLQKIEMNQIAEPSSVSER